MIEQLLYIALFGGLGAVSRFLINIVVSKRIKTEYAAGTVISNLLGCLIAGIAFSLNILGEYNQALQIGILAGYCGALTTYSTWMVQLAGKIEAKEYMMALKEVFFSIFLGLIFFFTGLFIGGSVVF